MMKRFIVLCCIVIAGTHSVGAQQAVAPKQEEVSPVSKSDLSARVTELNTLLNNNRKAEAEALFTDINKITNTELGITRDKMRQATNEADKKKYSDLTMNQRTIFAAALNMRQQDILGNKKQIIEKLREFVGTME